MAKKVKKSKSSKKKKSKVPNDASDDKPTQAIERKRSKKKKKSLMLIQAVIVATPIDESPEKTPIKENLKAEKKAKKKAKKAKKKSKEKIKKKKQKKKKKKSIQTESEPESKSIDGAERLETPESGGMPQLAKQEDGDSDDSSQDIAPKPEVIKYAKFMDNSDSDDSSEDDSLRPPSTPVSVSVQPRSSIDVGSEKKMDIPAKDTSSGSDWSDSDSDTTAKGEAKTEAEPKPNPDDNSSSSNSDENVTPEEKEAENPATKDMSDTDNSDSSSSDKPEKAAEAKAAVTDISVSKTETKSAASTEKSNKRKNQFNDNSESKKKRAYGESGFAGARTRLKGKTKRVFVGNLKWSVNDEKIKEFFKDIGEITDIYWLTDKRTGEFKGAGFVTFETAEAATKAVEEKGGQNLLSRPVKLDWTQERTGGGSTKSGTVPDWVKEPLSKRPEDCTTVFLGNLDFKVTEEDVRNHFKDCGKVKSVRFLKKGGEFTGAGFAEFESVEGTENAVKLCGKAIIGRPARVDYAKTRTFS